MRKKQLYGGLSPQHVRFIRDYLHTAYNTVEAWTAHNVWTWLLLDCEPIAIEKAKAAGLGRSHVNALKAGIEVLRRKRLGRLCDWNAKQSFAAIGITTKLDDKSKRPSPHGYVRRWADDVSEHNDRRGARGQSSVWRPGRSAGRARERVPSAAGVSAAQGPPPGFQDEVKDPAAGLTPRSPIDSS